MCNDETHSVEVRRTSLGGIEAQDSRHGFFHDHDRHVGCMLETHIHVKNVHNKLFPLRPLSTGG